jgi:hypothetical protein
MTAAVDGMVQLLLDTLSDVHDIIRMISNLTEQGYHAVQPANGIARNLTSAILELSINMQLIALNAQIRSVQSGQGTGLEVLAARTAEISVQINEISEGISGELSLLHSSIDEMLGVFGQFRDQGTEQLKALEAARGDTEKRLHALRDKTLVAVQEIAEDVERVHSSVGEAKDSLSGLPVLCAKLQESAQLLKRLQGVHDSSPIADKALQTHAAKYTMASEREVHDELIGINAGTLSKSNSTPSPVLDALFSEEEKYSAPLAASAGEQLPKGDKPKQAMGDNVELF